VPIQQAPIGRLASPALVSAVSNAGGLGMVGAVGLGLTALSERLERVRALTEAPFGVNFIVAPVFRRSLDPACVRLAAESARLVEFFYGEPEPALVETIHAGGALACWQVGSPEEAVAAVAAGCDLIVAQGIEAGGHVRGRTGLFPLLDAVLDVVEVPVIAAGGIGGGRALAAALAAGAAGARVGTRFIAAAEAEAHPVYVEALIGARAEDSVYTEAFSGNWPDAPHRVLRSCLAAAEAFAGEVVGQQPGPDGATVPVARFASVVAGRGTTGAVEAMSLFAGESVGGVKGVQPAAEILLEIAQDAEERLRRWT
jgi:NAD(P)H-dependent flavin oxidoreductase YrpB (nitropropane dioxygenase family)